MQTIYNVTCPGCGTLIPCPNPFTDIEPNEVRQNTGCYSHNPVDNPQIDVGCTCGQKCAVLFSYFAADLKRHKGRS